MKPGKSEIIEPTRYIRVVHTKRVPLFLMNAVRCTFFGWWLENFSWKLLPSKEYNCFPRLFTSNERYAVRLILTRKKSKVLRLDTRTGKTFSFRVYQRLKFMSFLGLCFLLLRSSKGKAE